MIISAVSGPLLGLVDTAVMGHLDGPWFLAAVAAGATVFNVLYIGLNFLRMGTTGITAQAFGARDSRNIADSLAQPVILALALACVLLLLQKPLLELAVNLLGTSETTTPYLRDYYKIRIWSAPATLTNLVIIGWLLGMQNARGPLAIMLTANGLNIIFDFVLVVGLGMEVRGVAIATVIAEYLGLAIGIYLIVLECRKYELVWVRSDWLQLENYSRLFRINSHLLLRSAALMFVFAFITAQGARLGDTILAANAVLMNFLYFHAYAQDGIAHAAEALTGKACGDSDKRGLQLAVNRSLFWTGVFTLIFTAGYAFGGPYIIGLVTSITEVSNTADHYLWWVIILPAASAWSYLYDGVYVGTTRSREMMIVMVSTVLLIFLPCWYVLDSFPSAGNHALWAALILFMTVRSAGMHIWYRHMLNSDTLFSSGQLTTAR
jgi:MATE family multidrug resistance protein